MKQHECLKIRFSKSQVVPHFLSESYHRSQSIGIKKLQCEILYVHSGTLHFTQEGREHIYPEGSVIAFAHDAPFVQSAAGKYEEYYIIFHVMERPEPITEQALQSWAPQPGEALLPRQVQDPVICNKIAALMQKLETMKKDARASAWLMSRGYFYEILALLTESCRPGAASGSKTDRSTQTGHCNKACAYIHETLHRPVSVSDVAHHVGISRNYLCTLFNEVLHLSPVAYINTQKVRKAGDLMVQEGYTAEAAATAVGISDVKYLRRLFRKHFDMTITEYKRWRKQASNG